METFDNGNSRPVTVPELNGPKLDGDRFCSVSCGMGCTKADFDRVSESALTIVKQLGPGWVPRVWENCGWHFEVTKGMATITQDIDCEYVCSFMFEMSATNRVWMEKTGKDLYIVMSSLSAELVERIAILQRGLLSVSIEPSLLGSMPGTPFLER